ncbi:MAG TPA: peptidoglycan-associated lipoprotein Pal [Longimicrobiales bacterium]|nr:peptidoglycan-associated lipoprotein Pal [Longimicrobiales bacterium]
MDRRLVLPVLLAALALGACGKKQPPAPPQPQADTAGRGALREDSLRAAQEAEARRAAEEAARARAAAEAAARAKATMQAAVYFDYDEATLTDDARATLDQKVAILRANPDLRVRVAGNADERGSVEYNLALGMRRAEAAKQYIVGFGIDEGRIGTISYGEERPADPGHDEDAWAKNRRDDFEITAGGERITPPATGGR